MQNDEEIKSAFDLEKSEFKLEFKIISEDFQAFHNFLLDNNLRILKGQKTTINRNKYEILNDIENDPKIKILDYDIVEFKENDIIKNNIHYKTKINSIQNVRIVVLNNDVDEEDVNIDSISYIGFNFSIKKRLEEFKVAYIVADNDFNIKWEKTSTFWINYLYSKNYMENMDNEFYFYPEEFKVKEMKSKNLFKMYRKFDINELFKINKSKGNKK